MNIEMKNTTNNIVISNANTEIVYEPYEKSIKGRDKTDPMNWPAFYTTSKLHLKEAWKEVAKTFDESSTFNSVIDILCKHEIRCHVYCQVD